MTSPNPSSGECSSPHHHPHYCSCPITVEDVTPPPTPHLVYRYWGQGPAFLLSTPRIGRTHEVTVSVRYGELSVWVDGRALRKDGEFSQGGSRCVEVDPDGPMPGWLRAVVADARPRLLGGA